MPNFDEVVHHSLRRVRKMFKKSPRDPERIDRILGLIGQTWEKSPDLRLGQLLSNALVTYTGDITPGQRGAFETAFNIEDTVVEEALKQYFFKRT